MEEQKEEIKSRGVISGTARLMDKYIRKSYSMGHSKVSAIAAGLNHYTDNILSELYEQIKHGDEEHQQWLLDKIAEYRKSL